MWGLPGGLLPGWEPAMTRVTVDAGACGFKAIVRVRQVGGSRLQIHISSPCEMLTAMNRELGVVDWKRGVFGRFLDSLVYRCAHQHVKHLDCPVPCAIIKAIQVEVGAAVPAPARIDIETALPDAGTWGGDGGQG